MINPLETLETEKKKKKNFPSLKCGYEGGESTDHESLVPMLRREKLARLQCFPCRDLEVFFQIFSKSQMSLQGGEKGPSTGLLGPGGREGRPATAFFPP